MARLFDGEVDVAHHQFSVETPETTRGGDVDRRFAGQANGLCGTGEAGMLHCVTGLHTGTVPVTVDLLDAAPDLIESGWEALDRGRPVPAPFHDREATVAAARRDLATPDGHLDWCSSASTAPTPPMASMSMVGAVHHAALPDPTMAFLGALAAVQNAGVSPMAELHAELRARFLT